jgi:hypothetical protein
MSGEIKRLSSAEFAARKKRSEQRRVAQLHESEQRARTFASPAPTLQRLARQPGPEWHADEWAASLPKSREAAIAMLEQLAIELKEHNFPQVTRMLRAFLLQHVHTLDEAFGLEPRKPGKGRPISAVTREQYRKVHNQRRQGAIWEQIARGLNRDERELRRGYQARYPELLTERASREIAARLDRKALARPKRKGPHERR